MSDDRETSAEELLDERLSALLDGELGADAAAALRAELDSDPRLAERLRELEAVDRQLRELSAPRMSADVKVRLRERIATAEADARGQVHAPLNAEAVPRALRRRSLWRGLALASAAALVGIVLYATRPLRDVSEPQRVAESSGSPAEARREASEPLQARDRAAIAESEGPEGRVAIAEPEAPEELALVVEPDAAAEAAGVEDWLEPADLGESALALGDELAPADVSVVEVLDWLEALDELEPVGRG